MENPRVILDTKVLMDLLRDKKEARALIAELESQKAVLSTTAVNAYELYYGANRSVHREENVAAAERLLGKLVVLQLTARSAQRAGQVLADLQARGQAVGLGDAFVGAIALTKGFSVVSRDSTVFAKIGGLNVIAAQKPPK